MVAGCLDPAGKRGRGLDYLGNAHGGKEASDDKTHKRFPFIHTTEFDERF
ncbi:MAG: hypothetical protein NVS2B16_08660 [Chloroflexota bacterium]